MSNHLKKCHFNNVEHKTEPVPLPAMCTARDGHSLRRVLRHVNIWPNTTDQSKLHEIHCRNLWMLQLKKNLFLHHTRLWRSLNENTSLARFVVCVCLRSLWRERNKTNISLRMDMIWKYALILIRWTIFSWVQICTVDLCYSMWYDIYINRNLNVFTLLPFSSSHGEKQIVVFVCLHNFCLSEGMLALYIIFAIPSSMTLNDIALISLSVSQVQTCCLGV